MKIFQNNLLFAFLFAPLFVFCQVTKDKVPKPIANANKDILENGFYIDEVAKELRIKEYKITELSVNNNNEYDTISFQLIRFNNKGQQEYFFGNDYKYENKAIGLSEYKTGKIRKKGIYSFDIDSNAYILDKCLEYKYNMRGIKTTELANFTSYYESPEIIEDSTVFLYEKNNIKTELTYRNQKLYTKTLYSYNEENLLFKKELYYDQEFDPIDSIVINKIEYYYYDLNLRLINKLEIPVRIVTIDTIVFEDTIFTNYEYNLLGQGVKIIKTSNKNKISELIVNYHENLPIELINNETGNQWRTLISYNDKYLPYKIMHYQTNKGIEKLETIEILEYEYY